MNKPFNIHIPDLSGFAQGIKEMKEFAESPVFQELKEGLPPNATPEQVQEYQSKVKLAFPSIKKTITAITSDKGDEKVLEIFTVLENL
jgi:hypothetical protein